MSQSGKPSNISLGYGKVPPVRGARQSPYGTPGSSARRGTHPDPKIITLKPTVVTKQDEVAVLIVRNIGTECPESDVRTFFASFGPLLSVSPASAFHMACVSFQSRANAERAVIATHGSANLGSKKLRVEFRGPKKSFGSAPVGSLTEKRKIDLTKAGAYQLVRSPEEEFEKEKRGLTSFAEIVALDPTATQEQFQSLFGKWRQEKLDQRLRELQSTKGVSPKVQSHEENYQKELLEGQQGIVADDNKERTHRNKADVHARAAKRSQDMQRIELRRAEAAKKSKTAGRQHVLNLMRGEVLFRRLHHFHPNATGDFYFFEGQWDFALMEEHLAESQEAATSMASSSSDIQMDE
eukprot:459334_1